ncbi:MAG TPA: tRNA (guanosine(37)-N1)-methyltransferase TrmD [Acidimicrobiales bacterium]|jgi:tRNA (guanine37-N1)-methyltransferase|nr:tRNA (guanosine(37)-N1)-methyltransferase TrmD [Acidimicrobiales bacterium]
MRIDVYTIFPEVVDGYAGASILGRARERGAVDLRVRDLRAHTSDARRTVDDTPFGGGAGMVLSAGPIFAAVEATEATDGACRPLFALTPGGRPLDQGVVRELAALDGFSLLCGRYEGIDQRVLDHCCDGELSVGDVVLAGGELAALVVIEAVARLCDGVLGNDQSALDESFADGLLEYPQYTKPATFRGWAVPEVLRSGDHGRIARWRRATALRRTMAARPDLIERRGGVRPEERALLDELEADGPAG